MTRWSPAAALGAALALLAGCGHDAPQSPTPSPPAWETVERTLADASIVIEKVSYRSQGLRVFGQVCRPVAAGPHPVMVWNHGGFEGLGGEWNGGLCADSARRGYVVVESSYRGEDGSQGAVEVCLGEVSDVLSLLEVALAQPYADRARVVMWGASHGGCITTRAFQRGAPVHAAVDVFGPSEWTTNYAFWREQVAQGSPYRDAYASLMSTLERAVGGTPERVPEGYAARSPARFAADLARRPEPFMALHGVEDLLVPAAQSCLLAGAAGGFEAYHVSASPEVVLANAPVGCAGAALTWRAGPRPSPAWPGRRYLLVYDTVGHNTDGLAGQALILDATTFVITKTPAR